MGRWTSSRSAVAIAALILSVTACGGASGQTVGDDTADPDAQPEMVDRDALVAQHEFLLPAPDDDVLPYLDEPVDDGVVIITEHDTSDARVVWTGLPCQVAPQVEVTGDQNGVVVAIDRGPPSVEDCESAEDFFAVDLTLRDELQGTPVSGRVQ